MSDCLLEILGSETDNLLIHPCKTVPAHLLRAPGPDYFMDEVFLTGQVNYWGVTVQADVKSKSGRKKTEASPLGNFQICSGNVC